MHVMKKNTLQTINNEIQRCEQMMRQSGRNEELLALEAEIFQRVPMAADPRSCNRYLGVIKDT